jgi:hypothetical protein
VEIDARGLKHPEPPLKLKEALEDRCSVEDRGDHWRIRIDRMCNC